VNFFLFLNQYKELFNKSLFLLAFLTHFSWDFVFFRLGSLLSCLFPAFLPDHWTDSSFYQARSWLALLLRRKERTAFPVLIGQPGLEQSNELVITLALKQLNRRKITHSWTKSGFTKSIHFSISTFLCLNHTFQLRICWKSEKSQFPAS